MTGQEVGKIVLFGQKFIVFFQFFGSSQDLSFVSSEVRLAFGSI